MLEVEDDFVASNSTIYSDIVHMTMNVHQGNTRIELA